MLRHGVKHPRQVAIQDHPDRGSIERGEVDSDYSRRGNFSDERGVFRSCRVKFNRLVGSNRFDVGSQEWMQGSFVSPLVPLFPLLRSCIVTVNNDDE